MRDNDLSLEQGNFVVQTGYESWNRSSWVESDAIEYMLWGGIQMNVTVLSRAQAQKRGESITFGNSYL